MTDVVYVAQGNVVPSGIQWSAAFEWSNPRVLSAGTDLLVTNSDGSVTRIVGTGLAIGPDGEPTGGTVTEISRYAADGVTDYESYFFLTSQPTLLELRSQGVGEWFLGGMDNINGDANDNTLVGGGGADVLEGNGGKDTLIGGQGDDHYNVEAIPVTIVETALAGSGIDTVEIADNIASFTLGANIEILTHQGHAGAFKGTGNALDNIIRGAWREIR